MSDLSDLISVLKEKVELSADLIRRAVTELISPSGDPRLKADFLVSLAAKGETTGEIAAFVENLREHSLRVPLKYRPKLILDVCGTGGDHSNTFNISTTVAIICAAAGIPVAKHGNRAVTSKCGSYDVLRELRIPTDLVGRNAAAFFEAHNFVFLAAPNFHPAFKEVITARKICAELGHRTIFNLIGPLLNPIGPTIQLIGVPVQQMVKTIGNVLEHWRMYRALVVCGDTGYGCLDEISTIGKTVAARVGAENKTSPPLVHTNLFFPFYRKGPQSERLAATMRLIQKRTEERKHSAPIKGMDFFPEHFNLTRSTLKDLRGGTPTQNAEIIRSILCKKEKSARRDAVLANAGAAFYVAGLSSTLRQGVLDAAAIIDEGKAAEKLEALAA